jgi:hypothetical protein
MPRYRFHLYNSEESHDQQGRVFPDFAAAHADAIINARALMADDMRSQGEIDLRHRIEIEEEDGTLSVVTFGGREGQLLGTFPHPPHLAGPSIFRPLPASIVGPRREPAMLEPCATSSVFGWLGLSAVDRLQTHDVRQTPA